MNGDGVLSFDDFDGFSALIGGALLEARKYEYDEENRLTAVLAYDETPLLQLRYDALGRRVQTRDYTETRTPCGTTVSPLVTRHVYDGLSVAAEYVCCAGGSGSGGGGSACGPTGWTLAREFVWGADFTEPVSLIDYTALGDVSAGNAEVLHYVHDDLGHVVGLTDAGIPDAYPDPVPAKLVERYVYDPYGRTYLERWNSGGGGSWERVAASRYGNPFGWTGQRYDAGVGLYAFLFRTYSPELGRWLQRDPAGFVDGVNVYEYVRSGPLSGRDPLGLTSALGGDSDRPGERRRGSDLRPELPGPPEPASPRPCGSPRPWGQPRWPGYPGDDIVDRLSRALARVDREAHSTLEGLRYAVGDPEKTWWSWFWNWMLSRMGYGQRIQFLLFGVLEDYPTKQAQATFNDAAMANIDALWDWVVALSEDPRQMLADLLRQAYSNPNAADILWRTLDFGEGLDFLIHFAVAARWFDGPLGQVAVHPVGGLRELGDVILHGIQSAAYGLNMSEDWPDWDSLSDMVANARGAAWGAAGAGGSLSGALAGRMHQVPQSIAQPRLPSPKTGLERW